MTLARASPLKTFSDDSGHRGTFGSAIVKPFEFPKIGDMTSPYTAYRELLTVSDKKNVEQNQGITCMLRFQKGLTFYSSRVSALS
jgi:hypothetical protein